MAVDKTHEGLRALRPNVDVRASTLNFFSYLCSAMEQLPTIDVVIATHRPEGIRRVETMDAPALPGVRYIVSWQNHADAPVPETLLKRSDMEIYRLEEQGVSSNRNNAIDHASAEVILVLDDDVTIFPEGILALQEYYRDHPEAEFLTYRTLPLHRKVYPKVETPLCLPLPKGYYGTGIELSFRLKTGLRFCPDLGPGGGRYDGGEDEAIVLAAIHRGLDCRYIPVTVCAHPHPSTGTKATLTDDNLRASGLVIALQYPWSAWLRVPLKAWRNARRGRAGFLRALFLSIKGAVAAPRLRRRNRDTLW